MARTLGLLAVFVASVSARIELDEVEAFQAGGSRAQISMSGNVSLSTEQAYDGFFSLKFVGRGGGFNRNYLTIDLANTNVQQELYGSMMVWVDGAFGMNQGDFTFAQAEGPSKPESGAPAGTVAKYRYRASGDQWHDGTVFANYDTEAPSGSSWSTDCWDHGDTGGTPLPRETWTCLEWRFNAQMNQIQYWMNGRELDLVDGQGAGAPDYTFGCVGNSQNQMWYAPQQFERLHIGVEQYHTIATTRTFYVDKITVGPEKIGCPARA